MDNVGEQFDVELDDILKEYEDLSGQGQSEDERGQRQGTSKDRDSAGPPPKKKRRVKEEQVDPTKEMVGGLSSLVQELGDELEIILFYYRKSYVRNPCLFVSFLGVCYHLIVCLICFRLRTWPTLTIFDLLPTCLMLK